MNRLYACFKSLLPMPNNFKALLAHLFLLSGLLASSAALPDTFSLTISTDNADEVYLNGVLLGTANDWTKSSSYSAALQSGTNVLAVKGIDVGGVAAMIAELTLSSGTVVSDTTWKVSATAPTGWETLGFNDSAWPTATSYGQYGVGPWFKNITGFPSTSLANWIWTADNNNDNTAYFRYTFTVGGAPLAVSTTTLTNGLLNTAYTLTLAATGGTPPYTWSVSAGTLPTGISLNSATGVLSGTPTTAGSSNFTVQAKDSLNTLASKALSITVALAQTSGVYYIYTDHLNTPRVITNTANTPVWRWDSDPFGTTQADEDPDKDGVKMNYNLRFPGQYYDRETGLHYNYFRDYDPSTGRYVESDPIGLAGGINTYTYVNGNPLSYTDPLGLDAEMCYRPIQGYIIPGQHCFMRFNGDNNDTSSFDPNGVHPDPAPKGASCEATKGPQDDDCVKREMKKCQNYDFIKNNCCNCAEQAMKACGQSIPVKNWPNWPINPGPQPGEPGYKR